MYRMAFHPLFNAHAHGPSARRALGALGASALAAALLLGAGCEQVAEQNLREGVSTEADVRKYFGSEPVTVNNMPDGSKVLDYPRQPEGFTNYRIHMGADGKMTAMKQLLHAGNFAKVQAGMGQTEVLELLGRSALQKPYPLKSEEVWSWRFKDQQQTKLFLVTFGADKRVSGTATQDDSPEAQAGGK